MLQTTVQRHDQPHYSCFDIGPSLGLRLTVLRYISVLVRRYHAHFSMSCAHASSLFSPGLGPNGRDYQNQAIPQEWNAIHLRTAGTCN